MDVDCLSRLIERPTGLCGYRPSSWCAVCGRKADLQKDKQCVGESCPNLCHGRCLGDKAEFNCGDTGHLRGLAGISDPVTFTNRTTLAAPDTPTSTLQIEVDNDDGLDDLPKEDVVRLLRIARQELASKSAQLTHYRSVTDNLVDKRSVLVEALSVWDTLLATRASEDIQQRSVACSARPHSIDGEAGITVPREDSGNTPGEGTDLPPPPPNYLTTQPVSPPASASQPVSVYLTFQHHDLTLTSACP